MCAGCAVEEEVMPTIRASSLNLARYCHGAHALAALHHRDTAATADGTWKHDAIRMALSGVLTVKMLGPSWVRDTAAWLLDLWPALRGAQLEQPLESMIVDGVTLTGHADALTEADGEAVVWDWKTGGGHTLPPLDEDLQMLAYATMWARIASAPRVTVHRVQVDLRQSDSLTLEGETLELAIEAVCEVATEAARDPDTRTPGHHCGHCLTRRSCPEYLAQAEDLTCALAPIRGQGLTSEAQAVRLLRALEAVDDAAEWARDRLKDWVRERGPVRSDGKEWGPKVSTQAKRVTVPTDETIEVERWQWRKAARL